MGIRYLNTFLRQNCIDVINKIHFSQLSNKKIVIDTSIYLYRFIGEDALLENFYLMISVFRQFNIHPLFVFDGKPPTEKKELLYERKIQKKEAEDEYNELKTQLNTTADETETINIQEKMDNLKKKFIRVKQSDIQNVKQLMIAYGVSYIDADGEADQLCASLVLKNKVYACLSEDMDLFVYGCPRVLRYLSLLNKTVIMYNTKEILNILDMSMRDFREICIVSGTDYNNEKTANLHKTLKFYKKFRKSGDKDRFINWLNNNTSYIENLENITNIVRLFTISKNDDKNIEKIKVVNGPIDQLLLESVLEKEYFIFI